MLQDLILLLVLVLVGRTVPPLPSFAWTPTAYDRILAAVVVGNLFGWAALLVVGR